MREYWDVYDAHGKKIEGKRSVRGRHDLAPNEYHLVVYVWIINDKNEFIISKRQKGRTFAGSWECTGGCALSGDTSLSAAMREVREELGLTLDSSKGERFKRYLRNYPAGAKPKPSATSGYSGRISARAISGSRSKRSARQG